MYLFQFLISRFNNAQHSRATTPKNTSTLVNTLDLVSMGSGSRKTRNKTPTSMAKTPTSNIVGSGMLSRIIEELEKPDGFKILGEIFKNSFVAVCSYNKDAALFLLDFASGVESSRI